ncbi:MAG: hypothetical protein HUK11_07015 [Muribaculaceae bacterium]|nr:hypothetical protein [Muribaculaceae bacterium]
MRIIRNLLLLLALFATTLNAQNRKWEVSDQTLTVYSTSNYVGELGKLHAGDVIEEMDIVDGKIKFNYNGKTGYVSTLCCKEMSQEDASAVDTSQGVGHVAQIEGQRYKVVSDRAVSVHAADGTLATIGHLWKDDELDAEGFSADGRFVQFTFNEQPAIISAEYLKHIPIALDADGNPLPPQVPSYKPKQEANVPLAILAVVIGLVLFVPITAIEVCGFVNLFFFVFKYQTLRRFYNRRAGCDFMPQGRLSLMLLKGLIPLAIVFFVSVGWMFLASSFEGSLGPNISANDIGEFGGVLGLIVAVLWVLCVTIPRRARKVGKRQAKWETIYSVMTMSVLIPVAIFMFNVMLVLLIGIPFVMFLLKYVIPGAFPTAGGAVGSAASAISRFGNGNAPTCGNCEKYRTMGCPYSSNINLNRRTDTCDQWVHK